MKRLLACLLVLAGCAAPKPFIPGDPTLPPIGCTELRARNGEC